MLPSAILHGKSSYEVFHGKSPNLDHIRIMECLCYATRLNFHDNFTPKNIPIIFMGYAPKQKGYQLYDIEANKFIVSQDVSFKEGVFPFKYPKDKFLVSDFDPMHPSSDFLHDFDSLLTTISSILPDTHVASLELLDHHSLFSKLMVPDSPPSLDVSPSLSPLATTSNTMLVELQLHHVALRNLAKQPSPLFVTIPPVVLRFRIPFGDLILLVSSYDVL